MKVGGSVYLLQNGMDDFMSQMTHIFRIHQRFDGYQTFDLPFGLRGR